MTELNCSAPNTLKLWIFLQSKSRLYKHLHMLLFQFSQDVSLWTSLINNPAHRAWASHTLIYVELLNLLCNKFRCQTVLSQYVCSLVWLCPGFASWVADHTDSVFGYMPAHLPHPIKGEKFQPGLACPPPSLHTGRGAGLPCLQCSAESLSTALV